MTTKNKFTRLTKERIMTIYGLVRNFMRRIESVEYCHNNIDLLMTEMIVDIGKVLKMIVHFQNNNEIDETKKGVIEIRRLVGHFEKILKSKEVDHKMVIEKITLLTDDIMKLWKMMNDICENEKLELITEIHRLVYDFNDHFDSFKYFNKTINGVMIELNSYIVELRRNVSFVFHQIHFMNNSDEK